MTDLPSDFRERGYMVVPSIGRDPDQPWQFVHELVGVWPDMVERQPIRPISAPNSFAGSARFTPFHTDSALYESLTRTPRLHRFYFGDVTRPTVAELGGHLTWTHSPMPATDEIGVALARELERQPVIEVTVRAGETFLVDNHRMLHGRNAFSGTDRDFIRVLAWFAQPLAEHPAQRGEQGRSSLGRLTVVLEMLVGVAPSRLAAREGVSEAVLYEWRNRALSAAKAALDAEEFVPPV
jgi:hypothetical protein